MRRSATKRVFRIEPGDLVISNVFAWEGAIAVASDDEAGTIGSHRFMTFVPADGRVSTIPGQRGTSAASRGWT